MQGLSRRVFLWPILLWKQRLLIAWWRPCDVIEDFLDGGGIGNIGDDPQPATTSWTDRDIDIEYPLEPLCPGERSDECVLLRGVGGCFELFVICLAFRGWPGACRRGNDVFSQFRIGCQHAMVMNVQIDRATESLNQRNTAALGVTGSVEACPFDQVCFNRADDNCKASAQCLWFMGEEEPQRPGEGEYPLSDRRVGQHIVDAGVLRSRSCGEHHMQDRIHATCRKKNEGVTAPYVNQLKRCFTVTHPFHPLYQRQFELLSYRKSWGREYIDFRHENGEPGAIPLAWTDADQTDPFLTVAQGRAVFRVAELLQLVELIDLAIQAKADEC